MSQPNIIFIMTDQQRWDALGVNGNALIHTPNLDRLGKAGASIQHSYTAAIACCPSRAGIWTGTYAHTHGVTKTGIKENPDIPTLAGELSKAGYMTSGVGKMHFNPWDRLYGFDKRIIIDSKYCKQSDAYNLHLKEMDKEDGRIGHHTPEFGKNFKSMPTVDLATEDHIDAFTGQQAVKELSELTAGNQPFFLAVSFCGPHDPYDPPIEYQNMYNKEDFVPGDFAENELDVLSESTLNGITQMGVEKLNLTAIPDDKKKDIIRNYYANIHLIDDYIGKLFEVLDQQDIWEDTYIIFTSDHGEYLTDHNLVYKGFLPCDADCRVPLLIKPVKGQATQTQANQFIENIDLMPEILTVAGCPIPPTCQGKPFQKQTQEYAITYSERGPALRIRTQDWAYVYRDKENGGEQLYDLQNDPKELDNLLLRPKPESYFPQRDYMYDCLKQNWLNQQNIPIFLGKS